MEKSKLFCCVLAFKIIIFWFYLYTLCTLRGEHKIEYIWHKIIVHMTSKISHRIWIDLWFSLKFFKLNLTLFFKYVSVKMFYQNFNCSFRRLNVCPDFYNFSSSNLPENCFLITTNMFIELIYLVDKIRRNEIVIRKCHRQIYFFPSSSCQIDKILFLHFSFNWIFPMHRMVNLNVFSTFCAFFHRSSFSLSLFLSTNKYTSKNGDGMW